MAVLTEFQRKQLDRIEKATEIEVSDLLKVVLDDLTKGDVKADGVLVLTVLRDHDRGWKISRYRAGLTKDQEVALLAAQFHRVVQNWIE